MAQRFDVNGFARAWNTHQVDRILEFYADDAELYVPPDKEPYRGKEGIRQNVQEVVKGLEDINGDVAWSTQENDKAAMLVHVSGRHSGPMPVSEDRVVPATDREVRFMLGIFLELDARGKIKRETDIADNLGLLEQVGAMPKAGAQPQEERGRMAR